MLPVELVSTIEHSTWFRAKWSPYLLADTDHRILAVNAAYEATTGRSRDTLVGALVFDAFPENPTDRTSQGRTNISNSFDAVFRSGTRHYVGVQRHDVAESSDPHRFRFRVWTPVNSPIRHGGQTVAVLNHAIDVTRAIGTEAALAQSLAGIAEVAPTLSRTFPDVTEAELSAVLIQSQCVIADTLGKPDIERAEALATLRLEVRNGERGIV